MLATGADDEFAYAAGRICHAIRSLRGEALVIMVVAGNHDIGVGFVKRLEEWFNGQIVAMSTAGAEERLVPVGECARDGMRSEVSTKPFS